MQRSIRPVHQPIIQPDKLEQASAPASAINAIMGRLGLAKEASEPEANEAALAHDLTDPAWAVRVATAQKLGHMGKCAPLELLLIALRDEHASVRIAAARALSRNPRQAALPALVAILTDTEWVVRTEAVRALGKLSDPEALAALLVAVRDTDSAVRAAALLALGETGSPEAIEPLHAALQDDDWSIREAATFALTQLVASTTTPSLLNTHLDQDPAIRSLAETGQRYISPDRTAPSSLRNISFTQPKVSQTEQIESIAFVKQHGNRDFAFSHTEGLSPQHPIENVPYTSATATLQPSLAGAMSRGRRFNVMRLVNSLVVGLIFGGLILIGLFLINQSLANGQHTSAVKQNTLPTFTTYRGHTSGVEHLAWSPDGRTIASADNRGMVRIWQVDSGRTIAKYTQMGKVLALKWSDASSVLVAYGSSNQSLQILQLSIGVAPLVQTIFHHFNLPGTPVAAAWSPDGSTLALDLDQGQAHAIQLWRANTVTPLDLASFPAVHNRSFSQIRTVAYQYLLTLSGSLLKQLAWSPDGSELATISPQGFLQIQNAGTGVVTATMPNEQQTTNEQQVISAAWISCGSNSRGLMFAQAQSLLWDVLWKWCPQHPDQTPSFFLSTQTEGLSTSFNLTNSNNLSIGTIVISPTGNQILLATSDGLVQVRNVQNGHLIETYTGHSAQVNAIVWSPNSHFIATASMDTTVQIWQETSS